MDQIRDIPWVGNIPDDPSTSSDSLKIEKNNFMQRMFPSKRTSMDQIRRTLQKHNLPIEGELIFLTS